MGGPPFCVACGHLLDLPSKGDQVTCSVCKHAVSFTTFEQQEVVSQSRKMAFLAQRAMMEEETPQQQGATVKEKCPSCGNPEMTFQTLQMRSADEGQTVFYRCPKCKYTYSVNN